MNKELLDEFSRVESRHWWWAGRRELVRQLVDEIGGKSLRILDVGCGTGETMTFIKKIKPGVKIWGMDINPTAVAYAKGRGHKNIKLADANKLPFGNKSFDVVTLLDVLEHIKNQDRVLSEIGRVLRPGGKLLVTAPALKFLWSRHDAGQGHVTRFGRNELRILAQKAGFEIETVRYFNFLLSGPIIFVRVLSRVPGFGFVANYDNGVNYGVVKVDWLNNFLKMIFLGEVKMIKKIEYPWGISIAAILRKPVKV